MKRQPGYYWVMFRGYDKWEIAYWHMLEYWTMNDSRHHFKDSDFRNIDGANGPLTPPVK